MLEIRKTTRSGQATVLPLLPTLAALTPFRRDPVRVVHTASVLDREACRRYLAGHDSRAARGRNGGEACVQVSLGTGERDLGILAIHDHVGGAVEEASGPPGVRARGHSTRAAKLAAKRIAVRADGQPVARRSHGRAFGAATGDEREQERESKSHAITVRGSRTRPH